MNFDEFTKGTEATAHYPTDDGFGGLLYLGLGVGGEAGEVVDRIKKIYREGTYTPKQAAKLEEEIGDLLYYIARLIQWTGAPLEGILLANHEKLKERYGN